ncbi:MAG: type II secretion system F family protein [Hyphomicrobiaceae bacterium]
MLELVDKFLQPQYMVMMLVSIGTFVTVLTLAMPMLQRDRMGQRMKVMATERDKMRAQRMAEITRDGNGGTRLRQTPKGVMQKLVERFNLRQIFESDEVKNKLKMAGLRGQAPLVTYMGFRLVAPIAVAITAVIYLFFVANLEYPPIVKFGMSIGAGYLGFYLPNVVLQNLIEKRQQSIKQAFPDALDMLLICVQAGMSVEAAFGKVAKEVASQSLELAEEFSLTTAELSYLQDRRIAFENLGKRTGLPGIKAVATALIQAERYGTPVGQALRVMAKENREARMSEAEKKAAALPPKLTVPMIVFFLPVLFVVILGPAVIQVMKWN